MRQPASSPKEESMLEYTKISKETRYLGYSALIAALGVMAGIIYFRL
jgi:hypothetical protein